LWTCLLLKCTVSLSDFQAKCWKIYMHTLKYTMHYSYFNRMAVFYHFFLTIPWWPWVTKETVTVQLRELLSALINMVNYVICLQHFSTIWTMSNMWHWQCKVPRIL
jgi:hypothetical protein